MRGRLLQRWLCAGVAVLMLAGPAAADIVLMPASDWHEQVWKSGTRFSDTLFDGKPALEVLADNAGSIKAARTRIDLMRHPMVDFLWAARSSLQGRNEAEKADNDFAARILITLRDRDGRLASISYAWSSSLPVGTWLQSPYSAARFLVVQSGPAQSQKFSHIFRDLLRDARDGFGMVAPTVVDIAIMSDTDQTGESTQAWYGRIRFAEPKGVPIS